MVLFQTVRRYVDVSEKVLLFGDSNLSDNKSAAGMLHTPPRNIFNTKAKIESENKFLTSIKGYNSALIFHNLPFCNPRTLLHNIKVSKGAETRNRYN